MTKPGKKVSLVQDTQLHEIMGTVPDRKLYNLHLMVYNVYILHVHIIRIVRCNDFYIGRREREERGREREEGGREREEGG